MSKIKWRLRTVPERVKKSLCNRWEYMSLCFKSLFYNAHLNHSYVSDVCMEPIFWFVDNFTHLLGPFFVFGVFCLTSIVVYLCHWIGLPYWWERSPILTVFLVIFGYWILLNVSFHYYKAVVTSPGYPPQGGLIVDAVSICKKCIKPKPPRTHHCSICNRCVLKMDHHCPWLNNCIGYGNHRYFYLYMIYTALGSLFIMTFGVGIAYEVVWLDSGGWVEAEDEVLIGHPVKFNISGHILPVTEINLYDDPMAALPAHHDLPVPTNPFTPAKRRAVILMALITIPVFIALGLLSMWHGKLISRGETSIEACINNSETKKKKAIGQVYVNPYDFGRFKNWRLFLGLVKGRSVWRHVLLPSGHKPVGNGLMWYTVHSYKPDDDDWP